MTREKTMKSVMSFIHTECTRLVQSVELRLAWVWAENSDAHRTSCAKRFLRSDKSSSFFWWSARIFLNETCARIWWCSTEVRDAYISYCEIFFLYAKKPTKHSHQTEDTHSLFTSKVIIHKECCAFLAECCTQVQRMLHLVRRVLHLFRRMLRYWFQFSPI